MAKRNPVAQALRLGTTFRKRVVRTRKHYTRKIKHPSKENTK